MKNFFTSLFLLIISSITLAQSTLGSGLVAYFPFKGNTIDVTGNGYDGIINGSAALVPDRFGSIDKAFTFPEQSSNIALANSTNLNLENGFTINAWIKYKAGIQRVIVDKHVCGIPNGFILMIDWDGQISIYLSNGSWTIVKTSDTFIDDQWYMVTATFDSSAGIAKVYVDGIIGASGNVTYNLFNSYPITIGELYQNNCQPGNMSGAVDEVKIYNRILTSNEILDLYNDSTTYFPDSLIAYFPFNGNANDESFLANHGTVYDALLTKDRYANTDQAYYFNGSSSRIQVPENSFYDFGFGDFTMSAWINVSLIGTSRIVSAGYDENDNIWGLGFGYHPILGKW